MSERKHGMENVPIQQMPTGPFPLDGKKFVGPTHRYNTIQDFMERIPKAALYDSMTVEDSNFNVTWQIYKEGGDWKYRLYQGMFYVHAVATADLDVTNMSTLVSIDGVSGAEDNIVLCTNEFYPENNGIWIMSTDGWYRHPIFDGVNQQLSGLFLKVKDGTLYKNSLWLLSNYGDITIGTTSIYFEQLLLATDKSTNQVNSAIKYSEFENTANQLVTLGLNLVPGMEYIMRKTIDNDKAVVLRRPGSLAYVGTLHRKGDWLSYISGNVRASNQKPFNGIVYVTSAPSGDFYLDKSNVYYHSGTAMGDVNLHYPIDCYDDFVYFAHLGQFGGTGTMYNYDGAVLASGADEDFYVIPAKSKYCTLPDEASANKELKIKIPAQWKLKELVIEHVPTTTEATGSFVCSTTDPTIGDTFTINDETYTIVASRATKYEVTFSDSPNLLSTYMVSAINDDSKYVTAVKNSLTVELTAKYPYVGTLGNSITITEDSAGLSVSGATLSGGTTSWPGDVTINIGTSSGASDIISSQAIVAQSVNTISINKILSVIDDETLWISSANWNSATVRVYATRDEGIS